MPTTARQGYARQQSAESQPHRSRNPVTRGLGGLGVDAFGGPVIDPTANVLALVDAAVQRQDDLRAAEKDHVREIISLNAEHAKDLREAESKRIDAIRAVDVQATVRAAEVASETAKTLQAQVVASAEALRLAVSVATEAQSKALTAATTPLVSAVEELRRAQYETAGGKQAVGETKSDRRGD